MSTCAYTQGEASLRPPAPPGWLRAVETRVLMRVFAAAFDVEPPVLRGAPPQALLAAFREFTAACMQAALVDEQTARIYRERLGREALALGTWVRSVMPIGTRGAFRLVQFFYRGIDIQVEGSVPGALVFGPCSFAQRYTPRDCWFMSAFDEGFIRGVMGTNAPLVFSCRITEGASQCCALMQQGGGQHE